MKQKQAGDPTNPVDTAKKPPVALAAPAAPAADPAHPDKDQDVELINSMLAKYFGKKPEETEESEEAKEEDLKKELKAAHEAFKAAGKEGEEAENEAVKHVQMSRQIKQAAEESEKQKQAEEAEEKAKQAEEAKAKEDAEAEVEKGKKEAAARIVSLTSENSALKERLAKVELDKHVEKTLAESGIPMSATTKFRETIGAVKNKGEFDRLFSVFKNTREATLGGEAGFSFQEAYANPDRVQQGTSKDEVDFAAAIEE